MPEFAFTIATREHACPRCGVPKGIYCSSPSGRKRMQPHSERTALLTQEDWGRCTISSVPPIGQANHKSPFGPFS
jgi:hypothetical protein